MQVTPTCHSKQPHCSIAGVTHLPYQRPTLRFVSSTSCDALALSKYLSESAGFRDCSPGFQSAGHTCKQHVVQATYLL